MKKNLILTALVILGLFLGLECLLRTTHLFGARISWSTPDPTIAWRFRPNTHYWFFKENDHPIEGKINSYGWKDREWSLDKSLNQTRIAVLGDSFVESLQVEEDKNFLSLTEEALKQKGLSIELMNFGKSEITQTEQLFILQEDILRFSPDHVLLFFYPPNDIRDIHPETAFFLRPFFEIKNKELTLNTDFNQSFSYKIRVWLAPLKHHSAFFSLLFERFNAFRLHRQQSNVQTKGSERSGISGYLSLATKTPDPLYTKNYELNKTLLKKIAEICSKNNIDFSLILIAIPTYSPNIESDYRALAPTFNSHFFEDDLRAFSKNLGIGYLSLQTPFRNAFLEDGIPLHWNYEKEATMVRVGHEEHAGHWNYQGHQVVSRSLTKFIETAVNES